MKIIVQANRSTETATVRLLGEESGLPDSSEIPIAFDTAMTYLRLPDEQKIAVGMSLVNAVIQGFVEEEAAHWERVLKGDSTAGEPVGILPR